MSKPRKERRRRRVYVTRNTEYHTFDYVCIGVRDRTRGSWCEGHSALRRRIEGGIRLHANGALLPSLSMPQVGEAMYFELGGADEDKQLVTGRVQAIGRPNRDALRRYPPS